MSKPVLIFVHGSWHSPRHFASLQQRLEAAGYPCDCVTLPSTHPMDGIYGKGIEDDTAVVQAHIERQLMTGRDVVVITHSTGSMAGLAAIKGFDSGSESNTGSITRVKAAIVLAGLILPAGVSLQAASGGKLAPEFKMEDGMRWPKEEKVVHLFYHDLEPDDQKYCQSLLRKQTAAFYTSPAPDVPDAVKNIPVTYLHCTQDNGVPYNRQQMFVQGLRDNGVMVKTESVDMGHTPFVRAPGLVANIIRRAIGEDIPAEHE